MTLMMLQYWYIVVITFAHAHSLSSRSMSYNQDISLYNGQNTKAAL